MVMSSSLNSTAQQRLHVSSRCAAACGKWHASPRLCHSYGSRNPPTASSHEIAIECQAIRLACERASQRDLLAIAATLDTLVTSLDDPERGAAWTAAVCGVPAAHGGFETLAERLALELVARGEAAPSAEEAVKAAMGPVDILVASAGVAPTLNA